MSDAGMIVPDLWGTIGIGYMGVSLTSIIYGITCIQTFQYFRSFHMKSDPVLLRYWVFLLWTLDSFQQALTVYTYYFYLIENFGNVSAIEEAIWTVPTIIIVNAFISLVVQLFFFWRIWKLSQNLYLTTACGLLVFGRFFTGVYGGVRIFSFATLAGAEIHLKAVGCAMLAMEVAANVMITVAMVFCLLKGRTRMERSDDIITRLIVLIVATGMPSAVVVIMGLVSYLVAPEKLYVMFCYFIIAKLDANALLTSLNARSFARHGSQAHPSNWRNHTMEIPLSAQDIHHSTLGSAHRHEGDDDSQRAKWDACKKESAIMCTVEVEGPYVC